MPARETRGYSSFLADILYYIDVEKLRECGFEITENNDATIVCWKSRCYRVAVDEDIEIPVEFVWRFVRAIIRTHGVEHKGFVLALHDAGSCEEPFLLARSRNPRVVYAIVVCGPLIMKITKRFIEYYDGDEALEFAKKLFGRALPDIVPDWLCYEEQPMAESEVVDGYVPFPRNDEEEREAIRRYIETLRRHGKVVEWLRGKIIYVPTSNDARAIGIGVDVVWARGQGSLIAWHPSRVGAMCPELFRQLVREAGVTPITEIENAVWERLEKGPASPEELKKEFNISERELRYIIEMGVRLGLLCVYKGKVYRVI